MALHGAKLAVLPKQQYLDEVRAVRGVATAAPVFMAAVDDADGTQAVYVGVETNILALKRGWRSREISPGTTVNCWPGRSGAAQWLANRLAGAVAGTARSNRPGDRHSGGDPGRG